MTDVMHRERTGDYLAYMGFCTPNPQAPQRFSALNRRILGGHKAARPSLATTDGPDPLTGTSREGLAMEATQNEPIKPIETKYAGCRFRSRTEARWVVFFNHIGVKWEYEPQGFDLPSGYYLPDFFLPDIGERGSWFEVKPGGQFFEGGPQVAEDPRWADLAAGTEQRVFVAFGLPSHDELVKKELDPDRIEVCLPWVEWQPTDDGEGKRVVEVGGDCCYAFCYCHVCDRIGIEFSGANERICSHGGDARHWEAYDPRIVAAYTAARSARFEHGEVG